MITILEEWRVVDRWWTPYPHYGFYLEVLWEGRKIIFKQTKDDKVWRIWSANRHEATSAESADRT